MVKLRPLEYIFSITNSGTDKLIMILGIPLRIDRSRKYKSINANTQIQKDKIVFDNFNGNSYGCNPKYIAEEIIKQKLPYDLVWLVKSVEHETEKNIFPPQIRLVGFGTKQAFIELSSAKIWIDNQRKNYFIKKGLTKKEDQYYIQTWHGSFGIKKLDADVEAFTNEYKQEWVDRVKYDSSMINYLLTNSEFENKIFRRALWFENEIKQFGHPRNDVFFKDSTEIIKKVKDFYEIPDNKKILLYVPSFRDDGHIDCYRVDYERVLNALEKKFGGEWVCLSRLHPRAKKFDKELFVTEERSKSFGFKLLKFFKFFGRNPNRAILNDRIIDGTYYPDIQELLVASDCAITDYSSCIFDFMLSRKPGFIFATDIDQFNTDRGFYYPLEKTPFPISSNNDKLVENIENFDIDKYKQEVQNFLDDKGSTEDGHASERVVELIKQIMSEE